MNIKFQSDRSGTAINLKEKHGKLLVIMQTIDESVSFMKEVAEDFCSGKVAEKDLNKLRNTKMEARNTPVPKENPATQQAPYSWQ